MRGRGCLATATALASAVGVATGCGDAGGGAVGAVVVDSAGIAVVHNTTAAEDTLLVDSVVLRLRAFGPPEPRDQSFRHVSDVLPLDGGGVVIVDDRLARVAVFDTTGRRERDLGRRGVASGEYRSPVWLVRRPGRIGVWDYGLRRLTWYRRDGSVVEAGTFLPGKVSGGAMQVFGDGYLDERESGQLRDPAPARGAVARLDSTGAVVDTVVGPYAVPELAWRTVDARTGAGRIVNPPAFTVLPPWTAVGELVAWSPGVVPRIELRDGDGRLRRIVTLPRTPRLTTAADRSRRIEAEQERGGVAPEDRARLLPRISFADTVPTVTRLVPGAGGTLWVGTHDVAAANEVGRAWDVLDPAGRLMRRVVLPPGFVLLRVLDDRAWGVSGGGTGRPVVEEYVVPGG